MDWKSAPNGDPTLLVRNMLRVVNIIHSVGSRDASNRDPSARDILRVLLKAYASSPEGSLFDAISQAPN
jgi:hypothetical protein